MEMDKQMTFIQEQRLNLEKMERAARIEIEEQKIADINKSLKEEEQDDEERRSLSRGMAHSVGLPTQFGAVPRTRPERQEECVCRSTSRVHTQNNSDDPIHLLAEIALRSHLPKSEPEMLDGCDITRFLSFLQAFDRLIACNTRSNSDLYYLEKYILGEPREPVRSCLHMDPDLGCREARRLLIHEYENEFQIANALIQKIQDWPQIKANDPPGLKKFSVFLRSCENYLQTVSALNQLNSPFQIQEIIMKLPFQIRERWTNQAYHLIQQNGRVLFGDLTHFVNRQANIASLPGFGDINDKKTERRSPFSL